MRKSSDYKIVFQDFSDEDMAGFISEHFNIALTREDLFSCETLGHLHRLVIDRLGEAGSGRKCATQMTFYRLRDGLRRAGVKTRLTPSTSLDKIKGFHYGALSKSLTRSLDWRAGDMAHPAVWIGLLVGFSGGVLGLNYGFADFLSGLNLPVWQNLIAGSFAFGALFIGLGLAVVIAALLSQLWLPRKYPKTIKTLGQLAEFMAGLNADKLVKAGARLDERLVWLGLVALFADNHGEDLTKLTPQTRFA